MNLVNKCKLINQFFLRRILFQQLLILCLGVVSFNVSANEFDPRQPIYLNEQLKAQLLSNMRNMSAGTQSIISSLAIDDMQAVAKSARSLGFKVRQQRAKDELHLALPKPFKMLGKQMHMGFDKIADDAETLKNSKHTLKQLADVLNQCQGCHEMFQVDSSDNKLNP